MKKKKVIIIGGGFGGLSVAKGLANENFDVLLFDKTNHHLFQPLLYQVASAALSPGDIAVPIREVVSSAKNVKVLMEEVASINSSEKKVFSITEKCFEYDYLVLAVGARHSYFGKPEWEKFAPGLKTLDDALEIRNRILQTFEDAEKGTDDQRQNLNFVVVGGGPTGVEMAGALAEISTETLVNDFRNIKSSEAKVFLIEGSDQILGMYSKELSGDAQKFLESLGVTVKLNSFVTNIEDGFLETSQGDKIETQNIIWAAGNSASPLLQQLPAEFDRSGRAIVDANLSLPQDKNIFVIGDAAHSKDAKGNPLPGLAPVAAQQGKYLAKFLMGKTKEGFSYWDKGSMATIGRFKAVLLKGKIESSGFIAWLAWCFVHILFLIDFRNKLVVFVQWAISFFFNKRGVRLINKR